MSKSVYNISLVSPWHKRSLMIDNVYFDPNTDPKDGDAVLFEYNIDERYKNLQKYWAWYFWEPSWHSMYRASTAKRARKNSLSENLLYYSHPNRLYRIPHITCISPESEFSLCKMRTREKAIAIVSNHGGLRSLFQRDIRRRNALITSKGVNLYGAKERWQRYFSFSSSGINWGPPKNYQGEFVCEDGWMGRAQVEFMSKYHAAVVLENSIEPHYFTEKFINAVRTECVPIYHAHQTVATTFLNGARWIDPADYNWDATRTIEAALDADRVAIASHNNTWFGSAAVGATFFDSVWTRIAQHFRSKLER